MNKLCLHCRYERSSLEGSNCPKCASHEFTDVILKPMEAVVKPVNVKVVVEPAVEVAEKPVERKARRLFGGIR